MRRGVEMWCWCTVDEAMSAEMIMPGTPITIAVRAAMMDSSLPLRLLEQISVEG